jgi:arylsulfatase A-like enzyme
MTRILLIGIFFLVITLSTSVSGQTSSETKLPNIVYIFADDLGYGDIGCFGAMDIKTPGIDRIAKEGIKFTEFYSASALCSPSRAALLTGRLPQRMGINQVFFASSYTGMASSEITIAELLKKKEYSTGIVGKWHLGHRHQFLPLQQGFDSYFGIPYSNDMLSVVYMRDNEVEDFNVEQAYTTKTYTKEALKFIDENRKNPFFLYVAHNMPHVPIYASDDFLGTSERGLYGDVIQELDWSVEQIVEKLEKLNLLENTLIVFSSDNGPWLVMEDHAGSAGILREGKQYTFEGGMRVPTVAMWKGHISEGTVSTDLASQMDWFPTIAKLAGIELPNDRALDGNDISDVLFNTGKRSDDTYLYIHLDDLRGYRKGDWKVKLPYEGFPGAPYKKAVAAHDTLLFNLKTDPGEKTNLYFKEKELAKSLINEMYTKYEEMGELPPSLVVRKAKDDSHYEHLKNKK